MNDQRIDLHMHSHFSDGVHAPSVLVELARSKGLRAIALCDHDSLDGFGELASSARTAGVEVITGVELSCVHGGHDLHVLGYGVDPDHQALQGALRVFREAREQRGVRIVELLSANGIVIDVDKVLAKAAGGALGRPHIAEVMVEAGYVTDHAEAFAKYIGEEGPAYVEKFRMGPAEAVRSIQSAGGLAFVAHPGYYLGDDATFAALLNHGFDGIEVFHPYHRPSVIERLLGIAAERGLLISGGSDFHGFAGRDNLGEPPVSYGLLVRIREVLEERKR
jgi:predicted metal-dependent phosphoesterase TrpH